MANFHYGYLKAFEKYLFVSLLLFIHTVFGHHWESFLSSKKGDHTHAYINTRDINFGGIFSIHKPGDARTCGDTLRDAGEVQYVESMVYAIEQINNNPDILGKIYLYPLCLLGLNDHKYESSLHTDKNNCFVIDKSSVFMCIHNQILVVGWGAFVYNISVSSFWVYTLVLFIICLGVIKFLNVR